MADGRAARADEGSKSSPAGGRRAPSGPVALYLFALVLVILIPALAVALVLLNRSNDAQQDVVRALTNATVQAIGQSVDRDISGMATTLRVLSTTQSLQDGDLSTFYDRAIKALAGTGAYLLALDDSFQQLLNTRVPFGGALGKSSDPTTPARALERGAATTSGLFFGQVAKAYVFTVWLPIQGTDPAVLLGLTQNASNCNRASCQMAGMRPSSMVTTGLSPLPDRSWKLGPICRCGAKALASGQMRGHRNVSAARMSLLPNGARV